MTDYMVCSGVTCQAER